VLGELTHDTGFFGEWNELGGVDCAFRGVLPASKNFKAGEHTCAKLDEGLEVRNNLVIVQRPLQVDLSLFPVNHCPRILRRAGGDFAGESITSLGEDFGEHLLKKMPIRFGSG
jgi:hypothetical protein